MKNPLSFGVMRSFLFATLVIAPLATGALGCGGGAGEEGLPVEVEDTGSEEDTADASPVEEVGGEEVGVVDTGPVKPSYDVNVDKRKSCLFAAGAKTTETVGAMVPHGNALPFDHVIVLMMENQSFDRYLSKLPENGITDVDVAPADASNPDPTQGGKSIPRFHETRYCTLDTAHNWNQVHLQYDDGLMDGFITTSNPGGTRAMGYHDETDMPYYYWLAKTYSISDRYFCSLLGPTWPNRFYLWGATSWGRTHTPDTPPLGKPTIRQRLGDAGKSFEYYRDGSLVYSFGATFGYPGKVTADLEAAVKNDTLPDVAFVDPNFGGGKDGAQNDEHPPANVQKGPKFVKRIVDLIASNPAVWKKTVLFITYDEHGGFYDHVVPPAACEPDADRPDDFKFDRYGIRVPLYAVSPWTKKGYVSHQVGDHASITRFIENRFDLGAMTRRDANAWPLLDMFDFEKPTYTTPPTGAPNAEPTAAGITWCKNNDPATGMP